MWNPINLVQYWWYFVKELILLSKAYRAVKGIEPTLFEQGLRVDWIGRVYAVINLDDEELKQPELLQQSLVIQALSPISNILVKYGLSDVLYPDIRKVEGTSSYLVILYPETDYANFGSVVSATFMSSLYVVAGWAIFTYVPWDKIV